MQNTIPILQVSISSTENQIQQNQVSENQSALQIKGTEIDTIMHTADNTRRREQCQEKIVQTQDLRSDQVDMSSDQDLLNFENMKIIVRKLQDQLNLSTKTKLGKCLIQNIENIEENLTHLVTEFDALKIQNRNLKEMYNSELNQKLQQDILLLKRELELKQVFEMELRKQYKILEDEKMLLVEIKNQQERAMMQIEEQMNMVYKYAQLDGKKSRRRIQRRLSFKRERSDIRRTSWKSQSFDSNCEGNQLHKIMEQEEEDEAFNLAQRDMKSGNKIEQNDEKCESQKQESHQNYQFSSEEISQESLQQKFHDQIRNIGYDEDEESEGCLQRQLEVIKAQMHKKQSMLSFSEADNFSEDSSLMETVFETVQPLNTHLQLVTLKNMIAKKRANQSYRVSSLILKLEDNWNANYQHQAQIEEDLTALQDTLTKTKQEHSQQIRDFNERIDDLLTKFEESEQQKIRSAHKLEQILKKLSEKDAQLTNVYLSLKRLQGENEAISKLLRVTKSELQEKNEKIINIKDQLKEANNQTQEICRKKNQLYEQLKNSQKVLCQLSEKIDHLISQNQIKVLKCEKFDKEIIQLQQRNIQLQNFNLQNGKIIDSLEVTIQQKNEKELEYLNQLEERRTECKKAIQKAQAMSKLLQENLQKLEKLEYEKKIMMKTQQDMKYLMETLKKDAFIVKQIEERDWNKWEALCNSSTGSHQSQQSKNILQRSAIFNNKEQIKPSKGTISRIKAASFTLKQNATERIQNHNMYSDSSFRKNQNSSKYAQRENNPRTTTPYTELVKKKYMM